MPHEKINHPRDGARQLVVGWNKIGWVQVSVYPEGWSSTGDAYIADLNPQEIDLLIRTLRRARRQAYGKGARCPGFEDAQPRRKGRPLFPERPEL